MEDLNEKDYKISVLMPIYIHENDDELCSSIDSIINQTVIPNEILIIADKDIPQNTRDILNKYKLKYPEIFNPIILNEPANIGKALSIGVSIAKYNYIARMDSDDIAKPNRFEKQIAFLREHSDIDVLGSWVTEFEENPENIIAARNLPTSNEEIRKYTKFRCPMAHMTVIFKKSSVLNSGNYKDLKRMEDYELWARMVHKGYKFTNIPEYMVNVRAGKSLYKRRGGFKDFINYEYAIFKQFREWGFINDTEFYKAIFSKFLLRIIPSQLRGFIYSKFLRNKKGEIF